MDIETKMQIESDCIFCESALKDFARLDSSTECICIKCGHYLATDHFRAAVQRGKLDGGQRIVRLGDDTFPIELIQGAIYESNLSVKKSPHFFGTENSKGTTLKQLMRNASPPTNPAEKIDRLLQNLDKASKSRVGVRIKINPDEGGKWCYARDDKELKLIIEAARDRGLFSANYDQQQWIYEVIISIEGWERISSLKEQTQNSKQGFVACWFSTPPNPNNIAILEGIEAAGYKAKCLEGKHFGETIISKALGEIKRSRFVIVDLTEQRKSVFFEAGYALGRGLEVIFVIEKNYWDTNKKDLEFYVKNYNIKQYEDADQLREIVESAIRERIG